MFQIRLKQGVVDATVRQQAAEEIAKRLGGKSEQIALLIAREAGSGIAKVPSLKQAEQAASIFERFGVHVEVISLGAADVVAANASATEVVVPQPEPVHAVALVPEPVTVGATHAGFNGPVPNNTHQAPHEDIAVMDTNDDPQAVAPSKDWVDGLLESSSQVAAEDVAQEPAEQKNENTIDVDAYRGDLGILTGVPTQELHPQPSKLGAATMNPQATDSSIADSPTTDDALLDDGVLQTLDDHEAHPKQATQVNLRSSVPSTMASPEPVQTHDDPFSPFDTSEAVARATPSTNPSQLIAPQKPRTGLRRHIVRSTLLPILFLGLLLASYLAWVLPTALGRASEQRAYGSVVAGSLALANNFKNGQVPSAGELKNVQAYVDQFAKRLPDTAWVAVVQGSVLALAQRIEDNNPQLVEDLRQKLPSQVVGGGDSQNARELSVGGQNYSFVSSRIGEGTQTAQFVYGVKANSTRDVMFGVLWPALLLMGLGVVVAAIAAGRLSKHVAGRISALNAQANQISLGDLDKSVAVSGEDEIHDLGDALERLRSSLALMMPRGPSRM